MEEQDPVPTPRLHWTRLVLGRGHPIIIIIVLAVIVSVSFRIDEVLLVRGLMSDSGDAVSVDGYLRFGLENSDAESKRESGNVRFSAILGIGIALIVEAFVILLALGVRALASRLARISHQVASAKMQLLGSPVFLGHSRRWRIEQTALATPSPVFWPPARTCDLNRSPRYAFGREHAQGAKILADHRGPW